MKELTVEVLKESIKNMITLRDSSDYLYEYSNGKIQYDGDIDLDMLVKIINEKLN